PRAQAARGPTGHRGGGLIMPQRWERQLRGLERLHAPESTRRRILEGPHGDGMPPTNGKAQRIVAGTVALLVFAGGLVFATNAFGGRPGVVPHGADAVTATLTLG